MEASRSPAARTAGAETVLEVVLDSDGSVVGVLEGTADPSRQVDRRDVIPGSDSASVTFPLDGLPSKRGSPTGNPPSEAEIGSWRGHFAFAIWDHRARALRAYRDHYGARPLYYAARRDRLYVSASLPSLVRRLPESPDLDASAIKEYLELGTFDGEATVYREVQRLPAASRLTGDRRGPRVEPYWEPWNPDAAEIGGTESRTGRGTDRDLRTTLADRLRSLFTEAVRDSLSDGVPYAVLLSGGRDSSAILGMAASLARAGAIPSGPCVALTLAFEENPNCDESAAAMETATQYGVPWRALPAEIVSPLEGIDRFLDHQGEPPGALNLALGARLLEAAAATGAEVVLDGYDADGIFTPSGAWLGNLFARLRWIAWAREVAAMRRLHRFPLRRALRETARPLAHAMLGRDSRRHRAGRRFERSEAERMLEPEVGLALETTRMMERMWGVNGRHPYFDPALVQFVLATPLEARFHRGRTKILLNEALGDLFTPRVQNRLDKSNYSSYGDWAMRRHLGAEIRRIHEEGSRTLGEYVDRRRTRRYFGEYLAGRGSRRLLVWRMLLLERFLLWREKQNHGGLARA